MLDLSDPKAPCLTCGGKPSIPLYMLFSLLGTPTLSVPPLPAYVYVPCVSTPPASLP